MFQIHSFFNLLFSPLSAIYLLEHRLLRIVFDLTEDLVEVAFVGKECDHNKNWEEEESDNCFPQIHFVLETKSLLDFHRCSQV